MIYNYNLIMRGYMYNVMEIQCYTRENACIILCNYNVIQARQLIF